MDDLLSFASIHMSGGRVPNGNAILCPESVAEMQEIRTDAIDYGRAGASPAHGCRFGMAGCSTAEKDGSDTTVGAPAR